MSSFEKTQPYTTKSITKITACDRTRYFATQSGFNIRIRCHHLFTDFAVDVVASTQQRSFLDWWGAIDINLYKVFHTE